MKEKKIFIVTGPIQTGKTTSLFKFTHEHKSVDGILAPVVDGKRQLYHISSRTLKLLEADEKQNTITVGKYNFLKSTFKWANKNIIESFNSFPEWLIIDELGKLELRSEGLHNAVLYILKHSEKKSVKIIFVIRDYLLTEILDYYQISENKYEILKLK